MELMKIRDFQHMENQGFSGARNAFISQHAENAEAFSSINGFINLDKPKGPTSHDVMMQVRKIIGTDKVGHAGTLDPAVTGVLPVAVGNATRLLRFLESDKEYAGVAHLHEDVSLAKLRKLIKEKFLGKIKQMPPVRSAVKREEREREIYEFKILEKEGRDILFRVHCQAGTYIRTLIHNLGQEIGGAHMTELRRTRAGIFKEENSATMYQLNEAAKEPEKLAKILIPAEKIFENWKKIIVKDEALEKLGHGSPVYGEFIKKKPKLTDKDKGNFIAVFSEDNRLIEICRISLEGNAIAKPEVVLKV